MSCRRHHILSLTYIDVRAMGVFVQEAGLWSCSTLQCQFVSKPTGPTSYVNRLHCYSDICLLAALSGGLTLKFDLQVHRKSFCYSESKCRDWTGELFMYIYTSTLIHACMLFWCVKVCVQLVSDYVMCTCLCTKQMMHASDATTNTFYYNFCLVAIALYGCGKIIIHFEKRVWETCQVSPATDKTATLIWIMLDGVCSAIQVCTLNKNIYKTC